MKKILFVVMICLLAGCKRETIETKIEPIYEAGTYQAIGNGEYGEIEIEVVLSETSIDSITILSSKDSNAYLDEVRSSYIHDILILQNPDIDLISGATGSCRGVHEALTQILEEHAYEETK